MRKGRKTLKAWVFFTVVLSFFAVIIRPEGDTSAVYVKDEVGGDCFAIAITVKDATSTGYQGADNGTYTGVERTQTVCEVVKDKSKVQVTDFNGAFSGVQVLKYPDLKGVNKGGGGAIDAALGGEVDGIKVTYCSNGPVSKNRPDDKCGTESSKVFYRSDYSSFEDFAKDIQKLASEHMGSSDKYELLALDDNSITIGSSMSGGASSVDAMCKQAGLKGLSWVACPVMDGSVSTVSALDAMIANWLEVDTNLYDSASATYKVWEVMRDIANVAMVIVLLFIIFSQITGVGIDNYGIKKMLPRLIAMAILVNLSFVVCQLAIDISNILGLSLNTMFRSIGKAIMPDDAGIGAFLATAVTSLFASVGIMGSIGGVALPIITMAAAPAAPVIVVLILLSIIPVLAAILLFFIMLGARMVLVIICTAIAPIVAVLYILPNTQRFAKKWWSLFSAILVMYPLCGAIGGISYLIKAMVLSMDGVHLWMMIVGVIGPFLPFFLLPTLLKNSLYALGGAGSALMAMGQSWRRGVGSGANAVQNSEGFRERMQIANEQARTARSQRLVKKLNAKDQSGTLSAMDQQRRLQAYRYLGAQSKKETSAYEDMFNIMDKPELMAYANTAENWIGDVDGDQKMSGLIKSMTSRGMEAGVFAMLGRDGVNVSDKTATMSTLANSGNRVLKAYGKTGFGKSYNEFMNSTDTQGSMVAYANNKGGEFVESLDDKALTELASREMAGGPEVMAAGQLMQAAATLNNDQALRQVNDMIEHRLDNGGGAAFSGTISGEQLTRFDTSTIAKYEELARKDENFKNAILTASNAVAADPKLIAAMNGKALASVNRIRSTRGLAPIVAGQASSNGSAPTLS